MRIREVNKADEFVEHIQRIAQGATANVARERTTSPEVVRVPVERWTKQPKTPRYRPLSGAAMLWCRIPHSNSMRFEMNEWSSMSLQDQENTTQRLKAQVTA